MKPTLLVLGASRVVGRAALEHFSGQQYWDVPGVSRRAPDTSAGRHISLDLMDREACEETLGQLSGVTHVIYAALFEKPGLFAGWRESDQMQTNLTMLRNCMESLLKSARGLRHVTSFKAPRPMVRTCDQ